LLTGANGSGKTTLIDALLTLLVPSNKRFYNQSSGAEIKKERDENLQYVEFDFENPRFIRAYRELLNSKKKPIN